jgi:hypothetical protein
MTVFDGGHLTDREIAEITVPPDELHDYAFCTLDQAEQRLLELLARRVAECLRAHQTGITAYLENGYLLSGPGRAPA